ncbi:MAG: hypothetical protein HDR88_00600 [Bacteroides sp.]|nr:hypothetical protein [Bacteroides sp.]
MASDKTASLHEKIDHLLDTSNLHETFKLLRRQLSTQNNPLLQDKLNTLEETYKYMIHYMVEGYNDIGRDAMISDIIEQLHMVNDSIERNKTMIDSPNVYSATRRFENLRKSTLNQHLEDYRAAHSKALLAAGTEGSLSIIKDADTALSSLFSYIWTMYGSSAEEYKQLKNAISSPDFPFEAKSQIISALLLGNLTYYDRNALLTLIDIYDTDADERLTARVLVAITLIIAAHPNRVKQDKKLNARLTLWKDSIITYRRLREVIMNVIRSRDTQRISSKMQNEVLPELMKLRPEMLSRLKDITSEADLEMLDVNPEWEELLSRNGLGDKLKELTEMQMDGGDVMMMAFSNLKGYPFFNTVSNWFLPFSISHSEIQSLNADILEGMSLLLEMQGVICDSDKYSFALSLATMPEAQRKMMTGKMGEQMAQLKEALADKRLKSSLPVFDAEVTLYMRDIYRFFKLYPKRNEFYDPFAKPLDFMNLPIVAEVLDDEEILNLVGEFYFKRGYYAEALPILLRQDSAMGADPLRWEKIGYCYNSLQNIEQAITWYKKAELLNPDSQWLVKKLALCNRLLNRFDEASEYYTKALISTPDNYSLQMSAGNCLLEAGNLKEAMSHFYHADYLKPGKPATLRAIAWGELLNGNMEKSISYYDRITLLPEATQADFINLGHAYYLSGNIKKGVENYTKSITRPGGNIETFEKEMLGDMDMLEKSGKQPAEIRLLIDKVKYDANS